MSNGSADMATPLLSVVQLTGDLELESSRDRMLLCFFWGVSRAAEIMHHPGSF